LEISYTFTEYKTGVYFNKQSPGSIVEAVNLFEKNSEKYDHAEIAKHASRFSTQRFKTEIFNYLEIISSKI